MMCTNKVGFNELKFSWKIDNLSSLIGVRVKIRSKLCQLKWMCVFWVVKENQIVWKEIGKIEIKSCYRYSLLYSVAQNAIHFENGFHIVSSWQQNHENPRLLPWRIQMYASFVHDMWERDLCCITDDYIRCMYRLFSRFSPWTFNLIIELNQL